MKKKKWKRSSNIIWRRRSEQEVMIIRLDEGADIFTLDATAAKIWETLDGKWDQEEIIVNFHKDTGLPLSYLNKKFRTLTKELLAQKLIVEA